ncbi:MAG TPA: ABC transporter ATP-binding protein [Halomonas sp.]|nr:ABC transporter ATP-binding protein [Halomonas sp.]
MTRSVIEMRAVGKRFGKLAALKEIDFTLAEGEVVGMMGHNGAGKSTSMKVILGLIRPTSGQVSVFGHDPAGAEANQLRLRLGYLPENVQFYEQLTGFEVLSYFARLKRIGNKVVAPLLERVGLAPAMHRQVKTYSKGMRQRLGLAQALIGEPRLMLFDEPTVGLDPMATRDFYSMVDELRGRGVSVILCSHVLPGVERHIDRAVILGQGKMLASGTIDELRHSAKLPLVMRLRTSRSPDALAAALRGYGAVAGEARNGRVELQMPVAAKIPVLRLLMADSEVVDLDMEPPTLESLYAHFDGMIRESAGVESAVSATARATQGEPA